MYRFTASLFCWLFLVCLVFSQTPKPFEAFLWLTDTRLLQFQDSAITNSLSSMPYTFLLSTSEEPFFQAVFKAIHQKQITVYRDAHLTTPISLTEIAQQFPVVHLKKKNIHSSVVRLHLGRYESWFLQDSTYLRTLRAWILRLETDTHQQNALSFYLAPNEPIPIYLLKMAYDYGADLNQTSEMVMQKHLYNFTWMGATPMPTAMQLRYPTFPTWKKNGAYSIPGVVVKDSFGLPLFSAAELDRFANRAWLQSIGRKLFSEILSGKIKLQYFSFGNDAKPRYVPISYVRELVLSHPAAPSKKITRRSLSELDYSVGLAAIEVFGYWEKKTNQLNFTPQKLHLVWGQGSSDNLFGIGFLTFTDIRKLPLIFQGQPTAQLLQQPSLFFWYPIQLNTYPIVHYSDAKKLRCILERGNLPIPTARDFFLKSHLLKFLETCR